MYINLMIFVYNVYISFGLSEKKIDDLQHKTVELNN